MTLEFNSNYKEWRDRYENEPHYTREQVDKIIADLIKKFVVNRVIKYGKDVNIAMRILRIDQTDEGITVIVD